MPDNFNITMDQLRVGLYIHLDLKWFNHPFSFSNFKIKNEAQIKTIQSLGLKSIRYDPALSDVNPLPQKTQPVQQTPEAAKPDISPVLAAKVALVERIQRQREAAARIENAFIDTAKTIHGIEKSLFTMPAETVRKAGQLVDQIIDSLLSAPELAIHVMIGKAGAEEMYYHSLNVTMLSLMMARDIELPQEVVGTLGIGALFHDIGHKEIPSKILMKKEPLNQAERHLFEMHCQYGADIGQRLGLAPAVLTIISEHHELFDGTGYPSRLKGEAIGLLSRIVVIANHYDELCNPVNINNALTPHEALSTMFAKLRNKFDQKLLQVFIRCLGVYPPGTIVQFSNGVIGMVVTVNTAKPMKPLVLIYDADIPRDEAILVDMACEADANIAKAIRPAQVPREIYNYLSPRKRVNYYFDPSSPGQEQAR
ncbi:MULTISPECIES: HD-GYP domain-containing protein [Methylomonas]|uniref:Metal-dependent phosphohydrolase n=1 Tax=Methylomonas koyamae TaxID=702114 RepID=A0A177NJT9_9GAMM|nr:HD domain-containing phosphohydrolase [Methylomonas koyamae]OAI18165.1 metal-dependent phosphohydrolase [Methylomonas koyamae]